MIDDTVNTPEYFNELLDSRTYGPTGEDEADFSEAEDEE